MRRILFLFICLTITACLQSGPTIEITDPDDGAVVSGHVVISAYISDDSEVVRVEFFIDDSMEQQVTSDPYEYSWNTYRYEDSTSHTIYAKAYDANESDIESDMINVLVDNQGMSEPINQITMLAGYLNGDSLDISDPAVTLLPNGSIVGQVILETENYGESNWVAPLAGTPSWGQHSTSFWGIDGWIPTGTAQHTVDINLSAPSDTGLYYIFFAWGHEIDYEDVMSLTHWEYSGGPVWDDGVDVADWDDTQTQTAIDSGYVHSQYLGRDGNYGTRDIPASAIRIYVSQ